MNKILAKSHGLLSLIVGCILLATAMPALSAPKNPKAALKKVNQAIQTLQHKLKDNLDAHYQLSECIENNQKKLMDMHSNIKNIQINLSNSKKRIQYAQRQFTHSSRTLYLAKNDLAQIVTLGYHHFQSLHFHPQLWSPKNQYIKRFLHYFYTLESWQAQKIAQTEQKVTRLKQDKQWLKIQKKHLIKKQRILHNTHVQLIQKQKQTQNQLDHLAQALKKKKLQLARLIENRKNLQRLVQKLGTQKSFYPGFSNQSKLIWPISHGKIIHHFNDLIGSSALRWHALIIQPHHDDKVYAAAPGKVVFSDFLKSYGLLLIIDHGKHYLSLYGHNQIIYPKVGECVRAGSPVAKLKSSKQSDQPAALFFGVWHNKKAIDPETIGYFVENNR